MAAEMTMGMAAEMAGMATEMATGMTTEMAAEMATEIAAKGDSERSGHGSGHGEQGDVSRISRISRRSFLGSAIGSAVVGASGMASGIFLNGCLAFVQKSPVTVLLPKKYEPPHGLSGWWYEGRLRDATMDFMKKQYAPDRTVPLWGNRFSEINFSLEARLDELAAHARESAHRLSGVYPVDPALLMAGMYVESRFYEYAISHSLAVGTCQFIAPTARDKPYGMLCAGDLPEHHNPPFELTEYAGAQQRYEQAMRELRGMRREEKESGKTGSGGNGKTRDAALLEEEIKKAQQEFQLYFLANVAGKSVLDDDGNEFLSGFDQRAVYAHAVPSMARFIATNLKAKNGNVLAAWAGYNAGLGSTRGSGFLKEYGSLPNGGTATYAQEIVLIADWINRRMFGER